MPPIAAVSLRPWPHGRRWVYTISFDEALIDLQHRTIPALAHRGIVGHLEVVMGQMGLVRDVRGSSFNGYRHMNAVELREMLAAGWGVGNHSWTHGTEPGGVCAATAAQELGEAKRVLEQALDEPITVYTAPGNNGNLNPEALDACRHYGYLAAMSVTDDLNHPVADDLLWLNRPYLQHEGCTPTFAGFDPFRRIEQARRTGGWLNDFGHCPLETPIHPQKDCSIAELEQRLDAVLEHRDEVWLARIEEVVDYRYVLHSAQLEPAGVQSWTLRLRDLPPEVARRWISVTVPAGQVTLNGQPVEPAVAWDGSRYLDLELDVAAPARLEVTP